MKKLILFGLFLSALTINAQDRLFTYTYQSTVLNQGQKELEIWNTVRTGRDDFYLRLDNRTEFEIGLGKNIQTAFYLNLTTKTKTIEENAIKSLETENEISFSNEWKWKLLDPVANPIGLALYGEYGIGSKEFEFEGKLIIDKKMNNFTIAANGIYEAELAPAFLNNEMEWEKETKMDLNLALAYSFSPKFHLTMENAYRNVFVEGNLEHSAIYSGLGVSCVQDKFWINFTILPQIKSFKGETNNSLNLNEFEKAQFRLLFSYEF
ncbi:MAG: hypothetical protein U0W24_00680 [Bacteroidales bacterium]